MSKLYVTLFFLFSVFSLAAQKSPEFKFGKITVADLQKNVYSIDSGANAVVLADVGKSVIEGNTKGWFSLVHTHFKRVHILKKSGYSQAEVEIPLYIDGNDEERLSSIKAVTYNLEGGTIVESKLDKAGIFTDRYDKNHLLKKFTFSNVKEGSIIEFEYTIISDFLFNFQPWEFQGRAPRLWSEYKVSIPDFLGYVILKQGYHPFFINENKLRQSFFSVTESNGTGASKNFSITAGITDYRWAMKDVPELKEESFTSTLRNHVAKIEFQLSEYRQPLVPKQILRTWPQLTKDLMEREDFGKPLTAGNGWLSDEVKTATANANSELDKAKALYGYVRDNIACTDHSALFMNQSLKNVLKSKKGNVSEVNLLLTAFLKYAHIEADPVLLSTRHHGVTYSLYPLLGQYNYVVCRARINNQDYYLDASQPRLGFGKLPSDCYNSTARLINEMGSAIELSADSLNEKKVTSVIMVNDDKGKWIGRMMESLGYYESCEVRDRIKEKGEETFLKDRTRVYNNELKIEHPAFDSLDRYEAPLDIQYDFSMNTITDDIIYFNPMFAEGQKENPFKSAERFYPVEMPYTFDKTFLLTLEVPVGYVVDELPKPVKVKLNEKSEGEFEYLITQSNETISLRSRLKFTRANFAPDEYELLREFYNLVVNKHNEQIVFKKKDKS